MRESIDVSNCDTGKVKAIVLSLIPAAQLARVSMNIATLKSLGYSVLNVTVDAGSSAVTCGGVRLQKSEVLNTLRKVAVACVASYAGPTIFRLLDRIAPYKISRDDISGSGGFKYGLILVEDIELVPLARRLCKELKARLFVDLRDIYLGGNYFSNSILNTIYLYYKIGQYRYGLHGVEHISVVSIGQQRLLMTELGIRSHVIYSLPAYFPATEKSRSLSRARKVVRLVYHGLASNNRGLELLVDAMREVGPNYELHLFLFVRNPAQARSKRAIQDRARGLNNVVFSNPVSGIRLVEHMQDFDVGVCVYPPFLTNSFTALPNKFFEYIQSRLAVIAIDGSDMGELIKKNQIGVTVGAFSSSMIARAINAITVDRVIQWRANANSVASVYCREATEPARQVFFSRQ
jgi:glycosyltransferase involved in cell wall biosynthesis